MKFIFFSLVLSTFFMGTRQHVNQRERYSSYAYITGTTLKLIREYTYNNPNIADDEFGTKIEITLLQRDKITIGDMYKFPSPLIKGEYQRWGAEDPTRTEPISGSLGIVAMTKEAVEVYIKTERSEANLNGTYFFKLNDY